MKHDDEDGKEEWPIDGLQSYKLISASLPGMYWISLIKQFMHTMHKDLPPMFFYFLVQNR